MNQSFFGSICLTDMIEAAKAKHSAFSKGKNGKIYANATIWLNESVDEFGNIMSAQLNPTEEMRNIDKKMYVGNFKKSKSQSKPLSDKDASSFDVDLDAPERITVKPEVAGDPNDLPF